MCNHIGIREFNFCPNCGIKLNEFIGDCVDIEGNIYKTMLFGDQEWMIENLKTTKYNDGTPIKIVECKECWSNLKTPAMCYYDNDSSKNILYNWYAVNTSILAPKGWHIPTDEEWTKTEKYIIKNYRAFNKLPGGYRSTNGTFSSIGNFGSWWSASAFDATYSWSRYMNYYGAYVYRYYNYVHYGFGVRCVRD